MSLRTADQVDVVGATVTTRAGWTRYNAHRHEYGAATLTNRTGGTLSIGDAAAIDVNNDLSVAAVDTQKQPRPYVVANASINNLASGELGRTGVPSAVKVTGTVTRGHYLIKSGTAGAFEDSGFSSTDNFVPHGAQGIALQSSSGTTTIAALMWGMSHAPETPRVLVKNLTQSFLIGITAGNDVLWAPTIPANSLGTSRLIRIDLIMSYNSGGSTPTISYAIDYGATRICRFDLSTTAINADKALHIVAILAAAGASNAQIAWGRARYENNTSGMVGFGGGIGSENFSANESVAESSTSDKTLTITQVHAMGLGEVWKFWGGFITLEPVGFA